MLSSYLNHLVANQNVHTSRFINTAHEAYLTPQWSYLMPVSFIHSHIHLTDLASYMFLIMKTMKWYDLKKNLL